MLSAVRNFFQQRSNNYQAMRRAVNEVGAEFEAKTSVELIRLVDNPNGAYEFERQFEDLHLYFVLEQMESGG